MTIQRTPIYGIKWPDSREKPKDHGSNQETMALSIEAALVAASIPGTSNPDIRVAASDAARDAYFGKPATAAAQLALQARGASVIRTDQGWSERYYATFNAATNPQGARVPGWYPVTPAAIMAIRRRTTVAATAPNNAYGSISAATLWSAAGPQGHERGGITYNDGFVVPLDGIYRVSYSLVAPGGGGVSLAAGFLVNQTAVADFLDLRAASTAGGVALFVSGSAETYIPANGIARLFAIGLGAAVSVGAGNGAVWSIEFVRPARS